VLIQSVGIALIGGLLSWMTLSFFGDRSVAKARLKFFLPIVAIALLVEALWLQRGGNPKEWPLPGYQDSYLVQLKVKSGNYPELGFASPRDVVVRVENNLKERTSFLGEVLTQRWIKPTWASPLIVGLLVLVLLGVGCSLLRRDSQLCALYFIGYECIYLLWPWSFDVPRFTLPVLPLAFLYLAEGGMALASWSRQYPRRVGAIFLPLVIILTVLAGVQMRRAETGYGLQEKISMIFWLGCTFVCARLAWSGPLPSWNGLSRWQILVGKEHSIAGLFFNLVHLMGALVVIYLILIGVAADFSIGRENLVSGRIKFENTPEIQAARWINSHTDPDTIVASRHVELIYHYSGRRVIWFPPITNPKILMDGIRQYHIRYVVIVDRSFHYYLPPDTTCFELLLNAYPNSFGLVKQQGRLRIYEVLPDSATQPRAYPDVPWSTLFHSENEHPVTFAV
jgi:hypothetical protein